jgi:tRNA A-37 threonylcarbamoyl transferase component Bud32
MMERLPKLGDYSLNPFREVELAVRRLATYGVATDLMTIPLTDDIGRDLEAVSAGGFEELPDPKSFLHLPAGDSLVSLDDARGYHELLPDGRHAAPRTIRRIGGALNFVYLIEYGSEGRRRKVVAKSYQNWYGLKWIPVSIWAIGAQNFDILGERRLTNEYRMNRKLKEGGLSTPEILHVSIPRRTIIEEYVPGRGFDRVAREYVGGGFPNHREAIEDLGEEFARIHQLGITLGDPKPDNAILGNDGRIWFVDLEQASEGGSATWDLAEFLYYSGHYSLRWSKVKPLAEAFIEGYLRNGERKAVGSVANSRYKRIFGVITAPHIVMEMAKLCRSYGASS